MYEMDYELAKKAFSKKGRINDHHSGSFEVIAKVGLTKCLIGQCAECKGNHDCRNELEKKIIASQDKVEIYSFEGEEPLKAMDFITNLKSKYLAQQKCKIKTKAPIKLWCKIGEDTLKNLEHIVIKRYAVKDNENNGLVGEEALTEDMYLSMKKELKQKISFLVDCKEAKVTEIFEALDLIEFSEKVGINEITFDCGEEIDKKKEKEVKDREICRMKECIEKVRRGENLHKSMIEPERTKFQLSIFSLIRNTLIKNAWHFDITKAISEKDDFFTKVVLRKGNMKVVLKQQILEQDEKQQMWRYSRSHKYIVEL